MSLDLPDGGRSPSPASSGRASPAPRESRRTIDEGIFKADKALRRYGATIERALGSWEISPQEWADYIAFLGRLLKAIQSHPKDAPLLPHSAVIASKLAQCLNPALPSGVHQKAIEVYAYIFATFGPDYIASHLHDFLPGLSSVLSFASLTVRPGVYTLYEDHITKLSPTDLRPVLKSLILSLLPALEDETSEDFERAFRILESLERKFSPIQGEDSSVSEKDGYFWQCLFLAVVTSPTRRQGALNFLVQKLPKFSTDSSAGSQPKSKNQGKPTVGLSPMAEVVVSPEPGLLIRCFACGLADAQTLIQRGFLDLLVSHLPLNSPLLQMRVRPEDLDRLVLAAIQVLLRREMSLNRRLWSWFLGPEPKSNGDDNVQPSSPMAQRKQSTEIQASPQLKYFSMYGRKPLARCILSMFTKETSSSMQKARPFRICLSLMDRWEIGGSIIPQVFVPAIENAYRYSLSASVEDTNEMIRSASLFFDGIEAALIWENLVKLVRDEFVDGKRRDSLEILAWLVKRFNVNDEEMLTVHIPQAVVYLLSILADEKLSGLPATRIEALYDAVTTLLDILPERVLSHHSKDNSVLFSSTDRPTSIREKLDTFYESSGQQAAAGVSLFDTKALRHILVQLVTSLTIRACETDSELEFVRAASLILQMNAKTSINVDITQAEPRGAVVQALNMTLDSGRTLSFTRIASIITLVTALGPARGASPAISKEHLLELVPPIFSQLWHYLSPSHPKYNVEAVKAIWQLQELISPDDALEASISARVREGLSQQNSNAHEQAETCRQFAVLWSHTIPASPNTRRGSQTFARKGSVMPAISDPKQSASRQRVLNGPLMLILDTLGTPGSPKCDVVRIWLQSLASVDQVLKAHFEELLYHSKLESQSKSKYDQESGRMRREWVRSIEYTVKHILLIIRLANDWIWQSLGGLSDSNPKDDSQANAPQTLAEYCLRFLRNTELKSTTLHEKSIEILEILLSSPLAVHLKPLDLDSRLIDQLMGNLSADSCDIQGPFLKLISRALKLRLAPETSEKHGDSERRVSMAAARPTTATFRQSPNSSSASLAAIPPPQLLNCLKMGFTAAASRSHLDQWLLFLSNILPAYSDAIFVSIIPLVECFCAELDKSHMDLISMSAKSTEVNKFAPEATAVALIDALEMVLARAHECLVDEQKSEPTPKPAAQPRSILGNMTSGVFKSEGPPTRTPQANSRLTVILTFQDAIRVSMSLWAWASHSSDADDFDKTSAATTMHNALKLRNRTRHLLEQIFDNEPLESLEVLMSNWCHSAAPLESSAALDLLHVMQGMRPKNVVPTILDSICSRTNPSALPPTRQSSQTVDMSAVDVSAFLLAYLKSIEDDAMDEVWSDCMAFLRDVLSNPLPYRQVLPGLLSTVLLLAQKIDNTNFGEQRKMRRDLGDMFLRLLGATFTTMPAGYIADTFSSETNGTAGSELSNQASSRKSLSLPAVLNEVTANLEAILESSDRVANVINNISSSLISPMVHAKAFPGNTDSDILALFLQISKRAPSAKPWKKDLFDAFYDPKLLSTSVSQMENDWFPLLYQWCLYDKERMPELLSRLSPPTTAGIMFGVGASAARLEADRKTQLNLRRACILLLCSPEDTFVIHSRAIEEKLVELFDANPTSSPSASIKAELFMLCRALVLSTSTVHLAPAWPIINDNLQSSLMSLLPNASNTDAMGNLALLQACKLLDLLVALSPDEFQLHEWLYITDTIDAVYQPSTWTPSALSDHIAESLASDAAEDGNGTIPPTPVTAATSGRRRPLIDNSNIADIEDIKASTKEDLAQAIVRPFLSQLSLHAYEGVYSMDAPNIEVCRRSLLEDVLDLGTVVE